MGGVSDSEAVQSLMVLFGKYKKFCFDAISNIPYRSVPAWIAFADGRTEEALKEKRGVWQNVLDNYVLYALATLLSIIAFWYVSIFMIGIFGTMGAFVIALGIFASPLITIAAVIGFVLALLLLPVVFLLLRGAFYHVIAKFAGGSGSYSDTLSIHVMTAAASTILMIPIYLAYAVIIGFIISPLAYAVMIYALYLEYKGFRVAHALSPKRAAAVVIGAVIIEFALYMGFYLLFYFGMLGLSLASRGAT